MPRKLPLIRIVAATACVALAASCAETSQNEFDENTVDREASVVYGGVVAPSSLDPHRGITENDIPLVELFYDSLLDVDSEGIPIPMLAESWDLDEAASTFTLTMRDGATFADGEPVDAQAVKANIERILDDPEVTITGQIVNIVDSVEVIDDQTAQFNLGGPGGALPTLLASRAGMLVSPAALDNDDLGEQPVGAGAFELTSSNPGSSYNLERRTDYWDDNAYQYQAMTFLIQVDTSTRLNALRAGESTLTPVVGPQIDEAESAGLQVFQAENPTTGLARVSLNTERSEFGSKEVRQAMNLAIDREAISDTLYSGKCVPSAQPYPEGYFAHSEELDDSGWLDFDPSRARELLAETGLPDGFTFTAAVPSLSIYQNTAQVIQQNLAEVGIAMEIEVLDATQSRSAFVTGAADALVGQFGGGTDPGLYAQSAFTETGGDNPGGLTTPQMPELLAATQESDDIDERGAAYDALMAEVFEMGPAQIALCHSVPAVASQPNTGNYTFGRTGGTGLRTLQVSE